MEGREQRAAGRESSHPQMRQAECPDSPGVPVARCAMPIEDAIADANALRVYVVGRNMRGRVRRFLEVALRDGSAAVVEMINGNDIAGHLATSAASAAFRAVPGLRARD